MNSSETTTESTQDQLKDITNRNLKLKTFYIIILILFVISLIFSIFDYSKNTDWVSKSWIYDKAIVFHCDNSQLVTFGQNFGSKNQLPFNFGNTEVEKDDPITLGTCDYFTAGERVWGFLGVIFGGLSLFGILIAWQAFKAERRDRKIVERKEIEKNQKLREFEEQKKKQEIQRLKLENDPVVIPQTIQEFALAHPNTTHVFSLKLVNFDNNGRGDQEFNKIKTDKTWNRLVYDINDKSNDKKECNIPFVALENVGNGTAQDVGFLLKKVNYDSSNEVLKKDEKNQQIQNLKPNIDFFDSKDVKKEDRKYHEEFGAVDDISSKNRMFFFTDDNYPKNIITDDFYMLLINRNFEGKFKLKLYIAIVCEAKSAYVLNLQEEKENKINYSQLRHGIFLESGDNIVEEDKLNITPHDFIQGFYNPIPTTNTIKYIYGFKRYSIDDFYLSLEKEEGKEKKETILLKQKRGNMRSPDYNMTATVNISKKLLEKMIPDELLKEQNINFKNLNLSEDNIKYIKDWSKENVEL